MKKFVALMAVVVVGMTTIGCDKDDGQPEAVADETEETAEPEASDGVAADDEPDDDSEAQATGGDEQDGDEPDDGDEAGGEFSYPGFDLDALDDDGREKLAGLAGSELCPCPDSVVSLHECMQEEERCDEADELASSLVGAVADGADSDAVFDQVARDRAESEDVHRFQLDDGPYKGSADGEVIIVEFADFQCPHCRTAAAAMDEVAERFGDDVGIFFKHFPLGSPTSDQASRAAMAAHQQGRFWQMHQLLFENQRQIERGMIDQFARRLGLNFDRFRQDMEDSDLQQKIARDRHEGMEAGVQGTPAIFIDGVRYDGAISGSAISSAVQQRLDE